MGNFLSNKHRIIWSLCVSNFRKTKDTRKLTKFSCTGAKNANSNYLQDIKRKKSANLEKNEIVYNKTKPVQRKKKHINTHQGKRRSTKENQTESTSNENALLHINAIKCMKLHMKMRGVLDLFESNKESILIYHLASLEAKNR